MIRRASLSRRVEAVIVDLVELCLLAAFLCGIAAAAMHFGAPP